MASAAERWRRLMVAERWRRSGGEVERWRRRRQRGGGDGKVEAVEAELMEEVAGFDGGGREVEAVDGGSGGLMEARGRKSGGWGGSMVDS
jgi:hypothetical protein